MTGILLGMHSNDDYEIDNLRKEQIAKNNIYAESFCSKYDDNKYEIGNFRNEPKVKKAMFAFSGDPIHYGHINVIERAARLFDKIVVGIGVNPNKNYLFTLEERLEMAKQALGYLPSVSVTSFKGLLVDYAYENGIPTIFKGIRGGKDVDDELTLHYLGDSQKLGIETVFYASKQNMTHVSSRSVKALQFEMGLIHDFVPLNVKQKLEEKLSGQYIVGITGEIGAGKSYFGRRLEEKGREAGYKVHNIELDNIGRDILGKLNEKLYVDMREEIGRTFGSGVLLSDGFVDRKVLGDIVFNDPKKLDLLNKLMLPPILVRLRREIYDKKGFILLNAALLAEADLTNLCNNNVILVTANHESQERRLKARGLDSEQITRRKESQYNASEKVRKIEDSIVKKGYGNLWSVENSDGVNNFNNTFQNLLTYFKGAIKAHE